MSEELTRISSFQVTPVYFEFGDRHKLSVQDTIEQFSFHNKSCANELLSAEVYERYKGKIQEGAFNQCTELTSVKCNYISSIGTRAFNGCSKLKTVYITKVDAPTIGSNAFDNAKEDYVVWTGNDQYITFRYDNGDKKTGTENREWKEYISHVSSLFQPVVTFISSEKETRPSKTETVNYMMDATPPDDVEDEQGNKPRGWNPPCIDLKNHLTCYAEWYDYYDVSFDVSGRCEPPVTQRVKEGDRVDKPDDANIITIGYYRDDDSWWYTTADNKESKWDFANDTVKANTVLSVKWFPNDLTLNYNLNGGTGDMPESLSYKYDQEITIGKESLPVRTYGMMFDASEGEPVSKQTYSWVFNVWNNQSDGKGQYSYNNNATVTNPNDNSSGSTTLYAIWDKGDKIVLPTSERSGYTDLGWWVGNDKIGDFGETVDYAPTKDVTATARWQEIKDTTIKCNVTTFGASPKVITYVDDKPVDNHQCEYNENTWNFTVKGKHDAVIELQVGSDPTVFVGYYKINSGKQEKISDFKSIPYQIPGTGEQISISIYLMKLESYLPYVTTVNSDGWKALNNAGVKKYVQNIKLTEETFAMTLSASAEDKFIASPGKLLGGHKYEITFESQHADDLLPGYNVSFGHRGGDRQHTLMLKFGLMYEGSESAVDQTVEYATEKDGQYTKAECIQLTNVASKSKQYYLKPLIIDLTGCGNAQFGVKLVDQSTSCIGVTFGGRYIANTNTIGKPALSDMYKNIRDGLPIGDSRAAKTKIKIKILS